MMLLSQVRAWEDPQALSELANCLLSLPGLEELHLIGGYGVPAPAEVPWKNLLARLPKAIKVLAFDGLSGLSLLRLGDMIASDHFPCLEELSLSYMDLETVDEAERIGVAFRSKAAGRLKTLHLHVSRHGREEIWWDCITKILSLNLEDPDKEILVSLRRLVLGNILWSGLACALLKGRFPNLCEISPTQDYHDGDLDCEQMLLFLVPHWYEVSLPSI